MITKIKLFMKSLLKKKTVMDVLSELFIIAVNAKHTNDVDNAFSIDYHGWNNSVMFWFWHEGNCIIHDDVELDSLQAIEELEKIKAKVIKYLKL